MKISQYTAATSPVADAAVIPITDADGNTRKATAAQLRTVTVIGKLKLATTGLFLYSSTTGLYHELTATGTGAGLTLVLNETGVA